MIKRNILLSITCLFPIVLVRDSFHINNDNSFTVNQECIEDIYKQKYILKESLYLKDNFENDTLKIETYTKRYSIDMP